MHISIWFSRSHSSAFLSSANASIFTKLMLWDPDPDQARIPQLQWRWTGYHMG